MNLDLYLVATMRQMFVIRSQIALTDLTNRLVVRVIG